MNTSTPTLDPGAVAGVVFEDLNGNHLYDPQEPGIAGVTIRLSGVSSTTTGSNGAYRFGNLTPSSYTAEITLPAGYVAGGATSRLVNVGSGGAALANFALQTQGVIQGVVFDDHNGNGAQDSTEPGIGGVAITRDGSAIATTAGSGAFRFSQVTPGSYAVAVSVPAGYAAGSAINHLLTVGSGGSAQANFALYAQGVIPGVVFEDRNGNGAQDSAELGIGGVAVTRDGSVTAITDPDGAYRFDGVDPGLHGIDLLAPDDYIAGSLTRRTVRVGDGSRHQASFALQTQSVIQGVVFDDANGNSVQDSNEPGISGVPVTINGIGVTATATDGGYRFANVNPGAYAIVITPPAGYVASTGLTQQLGVPSNGSRAANFGLQPQSMIQGVIFDDRNGNGVQESIESGVSGVIVVLHDRNTGQELRKVTVNGDGSYRFGAVSPGAYRVRIEIPPGYVSLATTDAPVDIAATTSGVANFALQPPDSIVGAVFEDLNNDTLRNAHEQGIAAMSIQIQSSNLTRNAVTGADGEFIFRDLPADSYTVTISALDNTGYVLSGPSAQEVYLPPGTNGASASAIFTVLPAASIVGVAEPGTELTLHAQGGVARATPSRRVRADSMGIFQFPGIAQGRYRIDVNSPPGFTAAEPAITLDFSTGGSVRADSEVLANGVIQGIVFEDLDGNAVADHRELGIGGAAVQLMAGTTVLGETVTAANGRYQFSNLAGGVYTLTVAADHFVRSEPTSVTLTQARPGANRNIGVGRRSAISGRVLHSEDDSGPLGPDPNGIANLTVMLRGAQEQRTLTDGGGYFRFDTLPAGSFVVEAAAAEGFFPASSLRRSVNLDPGATVTGINFSLSSTSPLPSARRLFLPVVQRASGLTVQTRSAVAPDAAVDSFLPVIRQGVWLR